ncbi:MAG TPA: hypothetical protein VEC16_01320 [Alphaproteobacteria bacterium]|nr:hypothetical protein [Alphaproteobacteria bacterium]
MLDEIATKAGNAGRFFIHAENTKYTLGSKEKALENSTYSVMEHFKLKKQGIDVLINFYGHKDCKLPYLILYSESNAAKDKDRGYFQYGGKIFPPAVSDYRNALSLTIYHRSVRSELGEFAKELMKK